MRVRIRFGKGARVGKKPRQSRAVGPALGALLMPAAVMAAALGVWAIAADLKWTSDFAISSGIFSHWQVWLAAAALLHLCSRALSRFGVQAPPESDEPGSA